MGKLYDRADIYDLLENEERYQWYMGHWKRILEGKEIRSFLDVSIGSGSVTLPMCELGVSLTGTDLSSAMLERCAAKAKDRGFSITTAQSDFREVSRVVTGPFDCVGSTGNSLAYVENADVEKTLAEMDRLVRPGGYLYFDLRNWEKILRERQRFYLYNPIIHDGNRVNMMQVWDYLEDGSMIFHILYTFEQDLKIVQKEQFDEHYYPIAPKILLDKLEKLGYGEIEIHSFPAIAPVKPLEEMEWYSIIAKKPE